MLWYYRRIYTQILRDVARHQTTPATREATHAMVERTGDAGCEREYTVCQCGRTMQRGWFAKVSATDKREKLSRGTRYSPPTGGRWRLGDRREYGRRTAGCQSRDGGILESRGFGTRDCTCAYHDRLQQMGCGDGRTEMRAGKMYRKLHIAKRGRRSVCEPCSRHQAAWSCRGCDVLRREGTSHHLRPPCGDSKQSISHSDRATWLLSAGYYLRP